MSKPVFTASKAGSTAYFDALNEYMEGKVLDSDGNFKCEHENGCATSCGSKDYFHYGQLHHVGQFYDLKRDGKPFRIIVSGMEYGKGDIYPRPLEYRTCDVESSCLNSPFYRPSNPHMKGTMYLLQFLFGREEPDDSTVKVKIDEAEICIFKAFSLANFLLCSSSNGAPFTSAMVKNCEQHYQKTLEKLQPSIVVLQGVRSRGFWWNRYKMDMDWKTAKIQKVKIERCENETLVLPLCHPTQRGKHHGYRWGAVDATAVKCYVKPAVEMLLEEYEKIYG